MDEFGSLIHSKQYMSIIDQAAKCEKHGFSERVKNVLMRERPKLKPVPKMQVEYIDSDEIYAIAKDQKIKRLFSPKSKMANIDNDPIRTVNFHVYKMVISEFAPYLVDKYQIYERMHDQEQLAALGEWAKNLGPDADKNWHALVNIEQLWGWRPIKHGSKIIDKVKNWVQGEWRPNYDGSEEEFNKRFREKVKSCLRWRKGRLRNITNIKEFCENIPDMGTAGSAYDPQHRGEFAVTYDGKPLKVNKNKFTKALSMTVDEKIRMLKENTDHQANVSLKVEIFPKVRTIVASSFAISEQMRFVDTWLKRWMDGCPMSTLWSTQKDKLKMWQQMAEVEGVNVPIDQSAFDAHATKTMVQIINEEILELIAERADDNEDLLLVMNKIIEAMQKGTVHYNMPKAPDDEPSVPLKNAFEWEHGILSGWQWTAFYDTLVNWVEMLLAEDICREKGITIETRLQNVQGDDQLKTVASWPQALAYWAAMVSMGLEINFSKNFFSSQHNEYLRKYSVKGLVNGYPARIVNAICWLYPGQNEFYPPLEKVRNIYSIWEKLAERCNLEPRLFLKHVETDVAGAKIPESLYHAWLHSPRSLGGCGIEPVRYNELITNSEKARPRISIKAKGLKQFELRFGQYQVRELKQWVENVVGATAAVEAKEGTLPTYTIRHKKGLTPIPLIIAEDEEKEPKPMRIEGFPNNVIFGKSDELMRKIFPRIDMFAEHSRAPRSWIYEYATDRVKTVLPRLSGYSDEAVSMITSLTNNSVIRAMFNKRMTDNKWVRINLFYEQNYQSYFNRKQPYLKLPYIRG